MDRDPSRGRAGSSRRGSDNPVQRSRSPESRERSGRNSSDTKPFRDRSDERTVPREFQRSPHRGSWDDRRYGGDRSHNDE
jgi:hypothetical protein